MKMLTLPLTVIQVRAAELKSRLEKISDQRLTVELLDLPSKAGGGSLPQLELPSQCLGVRADTMAANAIERWMRNHTPPIIGRIEDERFIMDPRTLQEEELDIIEKAFKEMLTDSNRTR